MVHAHCTLVTLSHSEQAYVILLFYCNNSCTNTPQCYVDTYIACIVGSPSYSSSNTAARNPIHSLHTLWPYYALNSLQQFVVNETSVMQFSRFLLHLRKLYMFRMSKASIIRSSKCIGQVGRYNVRVIVGSSYGVVRCVILSHAHCTTDLLCTYWAPDDGCLRHPKHVEPTKVQ